MVKEALVSSQTCCYDTGSAGAAQTNILKGSATFRFSSCGATSTPPPQKKISAQERPKAERTSCSQQYVDKQLEALIVIVVA